MSILATWRSFRGIVELERERGRERSWRRRSREARERERQAPSIRREFTLSAALLQRYGAGNSENVVPGPPGADRRSAGRVPEREEVPRPGTRFIRARRVDPCLLGFHLPARTRTDLAL